MSPSIASIGTRLDAGWSTFLRDAPYAGETFGDVLARQVRFRVTHAGATSITDVRPDSAAALRLWERPSTRQFVQGVLDLSDEIGPGPSPLRGFTLSTSRAGYVANRAVHGFRGGGPTIAAYEAGIDSARAHTTATAAVRKGAWLHLGPDRSSGILYQLRHPSRDLEQLPPRHQASLGRGVKTLLHELDHVNAPPPVSAVDEDWLIEGRAETLARWPGRVEAAGERLGMRTPRDVGAWFDAQRSPYQAEVDAVRGILRLTGIDPTSRAAYPAAERLLHTAADEGLPARLAATIATRHADDPIARAALEARLGRTIAHEVAPDGSNAVPGVIERVEHELAPRAAAG